MTLYRFVRFIDDKRAQLRDINSKDFVVVLNAPGPLAFVLYRVSKSSELITEVCVSNTVTKNDIAEALKSFRFFDINVSVYKTVVASFVKRLKEVLPREKQTSDELVNNLIELANSVPTNNVEEITAIDVIIKLVGQLRPVILQKLRDISLVCPIEKIRVILRKCEQDDRIDWNPDPNYFHPPFTLSSVIDGDFLPQTDVEKKALHCWTTLKFGEAILTGGDPAPNREVIAYRGVKTDGVLSLLQNKLIDSLCSKSGILYVGTFKVCEALKQFVDIWHRWDKFPEINWEVFLRQRVNLFESCIVLCANTVSREETRTKVPQLSAVYGTNEAVVNFDRLSIRNRCVILYQFNEWTIDTFRQCATFLTDSTVAEVFSTRSPKENTLNINGNIECGCDTLIIDVLNYF